MDKKIIIEKLKKIITPYVPNEELLANVNDNSDFIKDLEINSINLVDIVIDIENEFNIEIDNDSMEKMTSVRKAVVIITTKINSK